MLFSVQSLPRSNLPLAALPSLPPLPFLTNLCYGGGMSVDTPPEPGSEPDPNPRLGNVTEAIAALREAGLDAWDQVDDPEKYIRELRE